MDALTLASARRRAWLLTAIFLALPLASLATFYTTSGCAWEKTRRLAARTTRTSP